jgi:hypothetical protein
MNFASSGQAYLLAGWPPCAKPAQRYLAEYTRKTSRDPLHQLRGHSELPRPGTLPVTCFGDRIFEDRLRRLGTSSRRLAAVCEVTGGLFMVTSVASRLLGVPGSPTLFWDERRLALTSPALERTLQHLPLD